MSTLQKGLLIAGKYELLTMLGRGGMGTVWCSRHLLLDVDVVIKLMAPSIASSPELRARFAREARAAAQIKSPHVVQIHDYGVDGETPYIVMELLDGEDLGACLRREKRLPPVRTAALLAQIGRGLGKAHQFGIVHRDLKPANIFLARTDEEEVVKILDFGIARAMIRDVIGESTKTGEIVGSPPYMSPEQVRGLKGVDHRADLWSVGVVLFRMLTGQLPFQSESTSDLIVKICTEAPLPPSSIAPELPRLVDAFFVRVFERDPERRFASAREMVEAFRDATAYRAPMASVRDSMPHVPVGHTTVRMAQAVPIHPPLAVKTVPQEERPPVNNGRPVAAKTQHVAAPSAPIVVAPHAVLATPTSVGAGTLNGSGSAVVPLYPKARRTAAPWMIGAVVATLVSGGAAAVLAMSQTQAAPASSSTAAIPSVDVPQQPKVPTVAPPPNVVPCASATATAKTGATSSAKPLTSSRPPPVRDTTIYDPEDGPYD